MAVPLLVFGQSSYIPQGGEYAVAGALLGDQVYPDVSLTPSGGFLVWQDAFADGDDAGVRALRLDSSFSARFSSFTVNQAGAKDQSRPKVAVLDDGGAVFVWQGGKQGFQHIFARFLGKDGTWASGDILVNSVTNKYQVAPAVAALAGGEVVVVWASFNEENTSSMQGVYGQRFSAVGQKLGGQFRVNQFTPYNQRSAAVAPLSDGRFVVVWVSEQQRFENSVDVFARIYAANGEATGGEFVVNASTNICASPSVAASADGGFLVGWMQRDLITLSNSWDVFARPFSGSAVGGVSRRVNTHTYGDQVGPKVSANGSDYLVVWTSLGQDGSREGIFGQYLSGNGSLAGAEFCVNRTTVSQQIHPALTSDGAGRFLAVWTSFLGGGSSFDLFAQRFASTAKPLPQPSAPFITALSSNALSVTWPTYDGFSVKQYELYADGNTPPADPSAVVTSNQWLMAGLPPGSAHWVQVACVLASGQRSPLSDATTNSTYGTMMYDAIPFDWMMDYWGVNFFAWPSPFADSDGDGASNKSEFLAGTDPTSAASVLRVRLEHRTYGLYLNWNTVPGLIYQVQTSVNLGPWTNVGGARFSADTLDSVYVGGSPSAFYRVIRLRY